MTEYMILVGAGEKIDKSSVPYLLIKPYLRANDIVTFIKYPASIGPANPTPNPLDWGVGLGQSLAEGQRALRSAILGTPHVPVLVGYSLGAYVVSNYLEDRAKNKRWNEEIDRAILIANPRAKLNNGRQGIAGAHGDFGGVKTYEITNWDDMIASTPTNSPLPKLKDFVDYVTGGMKDINLLFWTLSKNNYFPTLNDAYLLVGYANQEQHVHAYFRSPYVQRVQSALA